MLLEAKNIKVHYPVRTSSLFPFSKVKKSIQVVEDVSFYIKPHEIVSLVGESGCGKSTLGLAILGLGPLSGGQIYSNGVEIHKKNRNNFRKDFQIIFQNPYLSLNPRHTIFESIAEVLRHYKICSKKKDLEKKIAELLESVGLEKEQMHRYPHSFSGGQRQRICIARVLAVEPKIIICDEIVSALDISVQAQIVELLLRLKDKLGLSLLWISHDLSLVRHISNRVYVMYLGKIVESTSCQEFFQNPKHPYTQALLSSVPSLTKKKKVFLLEGEAPSPSQIPQGCAFHTRCSKKINPCLKEKPKLVKDGKSNVACFLYSSSIEK